MQGNGNGIPATTAACVDAETLAAWADERPAEGRSRCGRDAPGRVRALHRDDRDVRANDSRRASRRVIVDAMASSMAGAAGHRRNGRCPLGAGASPRIASDDDVRPCTHDRIASARADRTMRRRQPRRPRTKEQEARPALAASKPADALAKREESLAKRPTATGRRTARRRGPSRQTAASGAVERDDCRGSASRA